MKVVGVSDNYAIMIQKQFGDTYYSVISKLPWDGIKHNEMTGGMFHCGRDHWVFGAPDFDYNWDDATGVQRYLETFESGESAISERNGLPIRRISIKHGEGKTIG